MLALHALLENAVIRHLKTRFVLANGGHAKWLEREDHHFVTIDEIEAHARPSPHPTATVHESHGPGRHGAGERDLAHQARSDFGSEIARRLNRQAAQGEFQRLALVAPAEVLSAIRHGLLPSVREAVVGELAKDLTKTPVHELGAWLDRPDFG